MDSERLIKDYEHEKHQERKRKGAHLEAIFEQSGKKPTHDTNENNNKDRMVNKDSENGNLASFGSPEIASYTTALENTEKLSASSRNVSGNTETSVGNAGNAYENTGNATENPRNSSGNTVTPLRNTRNIMGNSGIRMEHVRNLSAIPRSPSGKANSSLESTSRSVSYNHDSSSTSRERREPDQECPERQIEQNISGGNHYTGFKQIQSSGYDSSSAKEKQPIKGSEFPSAVTIKKEKTDDPPPVQDMPVQSQVERGKSLTEDNGEIGDDCLKFLLFSGKLYNCERVSDLTHSFSRFIGDSVLGRKGKVVVLLLFHKTLREVLNYVVGVVDHYTLEEHNIIIKIIKHHTHPTTSIPTKEVEKSAAKLVVGSKKLLYNLQPLHGPVYAELVKILDGFGANSAVDHAKISEFNAMVNANADRLDGQISNILGGVGYPYRGTFANRNFVPTTYSYLGSRFPQSSTRYSSLTTQINTTRHSPEKSHGGSHGSSNDRSKSADAEIENGYQRRMSASYHREGHHVNTVSANQTVRITPRTANSNVEHIRAASAIPIAPNARFRSTLEDGSLASQRRNVEDLQTVAELCKEKMKRDMAEQELKSIKAAFEEFKSQMQQHLSQVEERMVLLEAENRTLKGKLSNMHQNNGFAEKKYHELRSQLEDLLKST